MIGLHFFNPVPMLQLVELVPSLLTSNNVTARVRQFATSQLGKVAVTAPR